MLFLRNCSAHVMCLAESSGITDDSFRTRLRGWTFASSYRKNLAGGVRGYGAARMRVIYDSTDPSSPGGRDDHDDPSIPLAAEVYPGTSLRKLTLELSMPMIIRIGRKKDPLDLIPPKWNGTNDIAGKMRVLAFVVNNKHVKSSEYYARLRLRQLFLDVARYQVVIFLAVMQIQLCTNISGTSTFGLSNALASTSCRKRSLQPFTLLIMIHSTWCLPTSSVPNVRTT